MLSRARQKNLVAEEIGGELVVYDLERHQVHRLNRTTSWVWRHCDGHTPVAAMAAELERELGLPANEHVVWVALEQLERARLLCERLARSPEERRISRREVVAFSLVGAAALLLPGCDSITAPRRTSRSAEEALPSASPGADTFCLVEVLEVKAVLKDQACPTKVGDTLCLKCRPPKGKKEGAPPECPISSPLTGATFTVDKPPVLDLYMPGTDCKKPAFRKVCIVKVKLTREPCDVCPAGAKKEDVDFKLCP